MQTNSISLHIGLTSALKDQTDNFSISMIQADKNISLHSELISAIKGQTDNLSIANIQANKSCFFLLLLFCILS